MTHQSIANVYIVKHVIRRGHWSVVNKYPAQACAAGYLCRKTSLRIRTAALQIEKAIPGYMNEQAFAARGHDAVGPYFPHQVILAALDLLDPSNQLQFSAQRCGAFQARGQGPGDTGLAGHPLRNAEELIEESANETAVHRIGRTFVLPTERGATVCDIALDPGIEGRGDRITFAVDRIELVAQP